MCNDVPDKKYSWIENSSKGAVQTAHTAENCVRVLFTGCIDKAVVYYDLFPINISTSIIFQIQEQWIFF